MKKKKFTLIDGTFNAEDGQKILMDVFASKIHYHEKKRLTALIKNDKVDTFATERIHALKTQVEELKTTFETLDPKTQISIHCEIFINPTSEP